MSPQVPDRVRSVIAASIGTGLGSSAGAILPFVLTHHFGVNRETDVYFIVVGAVQLVAYVLGMVAEAAALPIISLAIAKDPGNARAAATAVILRVVPIAALVNVALLAVTAVVVLPAAGVSILSDRSALAFLLVGIPMGALSTAGGLAAGANFALMRFAFTTGSQVFRAGTALLLVTVFSGAGLVVAAVGLCLGELLRFCVLYFRLPGPYTDGEIGSIPLGRQVLQLAGPTLISSAVIAANPLIDKTIAARVAVGGPTVLELAEKIYFIPSVLLVAAISKVSAGHWSRMAAEGKHDLLHDYRKVQVVSIVSGFAAALLLAITFHLAAAYIPFVQSQVAQAGVHFETVLLIFLLGLPFALSSDLSNSMILVMRRSRVMPPIALLLVSVNLVADLAGAAVWGIAGIAVASTGVRVLACIINMAVVVRGLRELRESTPAE